MDVVLGVVSGPLALSAAHYMMECARWNAHATPPYADVISAVSEFPATADQRDHKEITTNTKLSTTAQPGLVWSLLTSQYPNAHLTWAEWLAYQAAAGPSEQHEGLVVTAYPRPAQLRSTTHLDYDATARPDWPLPGTTVPNGRLTWAAWLTYQARGLAVREPQLATPERAA